jgi:hypothetical protein
VDGNSHTASNPRDPGKSMRARVKSAMCLYLGALPRLAVGGRRGEILAAIAWPSWVHGKKIARISILGVRDIRDEKHAYEADRREPSKATHRPSRVSRALHIPFWLRSGSESPGRRPSTTRRIVASWRTLLLLRGDWRPIGDRPFPDLRRDSNSANTSSIRG